MATNIRIPVEIFNEVYLPFVQDYTHRYEVYKGSAGSGKSHFVAQKLLIKCFTSRRKVLALRKVGVTVKDSIWIMFMEQLSLFQIKDQCKINVSNFTIELPNGSMILCKGLDDPEKIKSIAGITDIFMEEATEFTIDDFSQLDFRLRALDDNLQIFLALNPTSKSSWIYSKYFDPMKNDVDPETTLIIETTYKDNAFLPDSYIKMLEDSIKGDPIRYKVYVLGEWASLGQRVYETYTIQDFDIDEVKAKHYSYFGLDYGFVNDPTALIAVAVDNETKTIYIYDEFTKKGLVNSAIAEVIKSKGYAKEIITADAAEKKSTEEIKRCGVTRIKNALKGADSVIYGIKKIKSFTLVVHPSCKETIVELDNYCWQKDNQTGEYIEKPVDRSNHLMDALRYALEDVNKQTKLKTMNKKLLGL